MWIPWEGFAAVINYEILTAQVDAKLGELSQAQSATMRAALLAFARVLQTRIRMGFRQGKAPSGASWAPLNTFFRSGQPLRDTGRLMGSVNAVPDGDGVLVGTNLRTPGGDHSLGAIHQFGATVVPRPGPGKTFRGRLLGPIPTTGGGGFIFLRKAVIPARPFMPLDATGDTVVLPPAWELSALKSMARAMGLGAA